MLIGSLVVCRSFRFVWFRVIIFHAPANCVRVPLKRTKSFRPFVRRLRSSADRTLIQSSALSWKCEHSLDSNWIRFDDEDERSSRRLERRAGRQMCHLHNPVRFGCFLGTELKRQSDRISSVSHEIDCEPHSNCALAARAALSKHLRGERLYLRRAQSSSAVAGGSALSSNG